MKIIFIRLLLFFYLSSAYLGATHIHNDALESSTDCKVCIVVKNLNSGDVLDTQIDTLVCNNCYEIIFFKVERVKRDILKGFHANAPPLS